jgi:hypothetical protein
MDPKFDPLLSYAQQLGYHFPSVDNQVECVKWTSLLVKQCEINAEISKLTNEVDFLQQQMDAFDLTSKDQLRTLSFSEFDMVILITRFYMF